MTEADVTAWYERQELASISRFDHTGRTIARERAANLATEQLAAQQGKAAATHAERQAWLDDQWELLVANDPQVAMETVDVALSDNLATAAPFGFVDDDDLVVVIAPDKADLIDLRRRLGRLTDRQISQFHLRRISSHTLLTARETHVPHASIAKHTVRRLNP